MTTSFRFDPIELPPVCEMLRREVRGFLAAERAAGRWRAGGDFGSRHDAALDRKSTRLNSSHRL